MKVATSKKTMILCVVESYLLRFIGLKSLFDTEQDLELIWCSLAELDGARTSTWCSLVDVQDRTFLM